MLAEFAVDDEVVTVAKLGFRADAAANTFKNQHRVIETLDNDLRMCQTLIVDNRRVT